VWHVKHNTWKQADGNPIRSRAQKVRGIGLLVHQHRFGDDTKHDKILAPAKKDAWEESDPLAVWLDFGGALKLLAELNDEDPENTSREQVYKMFDSLDGAKNWRVDEGHKVRKERARRYFLNEVDCEVIEIDVAAQEKDMGSIFQIFVTHLLGEPTNDTKKTLSFNDTLKLLSFMNICPAYMTGNDVAKHYQHVLHKRRDSQNEAKRNTDARFALGFHEPKRLDLRDFELMMQLVAKEMGVSLHNLGRIRHAWLHKPPVDMKSLCARMNPKGEKLTIRSKDVPRHDSDDYQIHLSVGALKIARDTMEVLNQKGVEFSSIQLFVATSWGREYKGKTHKIYQRKTYKKKLKTGVFKQNFWLFNLYEEFLIEVPLKAMEYDEDWLSGNLYIQLGFNYFDYKKAARSSTGGGYEHQKVASLTLMMPENAETDGPVEWLSFAQFMGQADRRDSETLANLHKMPPMMRLRYRTARGHKLRQAHDCIKAFYRYELHHTVGDAMFAMIQSAMPGYVARKIEALSEDIVTRVFDIIVFSEIGLCVNDLFEGTDAMDCLDLGGCDLSKLTMRVWMSSSSPFRACTLSALPTARHSIHGQYPNGHTNWAS